MRTALVIIAMLGLGYGLGVGTRAKPTATNGLALAVDCQRGDRRACDAAQPFAAVYGDYELYELDASCVIGGDPFACEEVANALHGDGDEASSPAMRPVAASRMARALELFVAGCATGHAEHCFGASRAYDAGFGVMWNELASRTYGTTACQRGVLTACEREGDRDTGAEAIAMYRLACPASPHACMKLARAEEAASAPTAVADYRVACDRRVVEACAQLAAARGTR